MINSGLEAGVAPLSVQPFKLAKLKKETAKHICLELFLLSLLRESRITLLYDLVTLGKALYRSCRLFSKEAELGYRFLTLYSTCHGHSVMAK